MTLNEFKMWLEGYLNGANISKELIDSIFNKFKEVVITNEDISQQFDIHKLFPKGIPPEEVKPLKQFPLPLPFSDDKDHWWDVTCAAARNGGCFCTGACNRKKF